MPAGVLRHLIDFQQRTDSRDSSGQVVGSWASLHRKVPAGFVEVSGGEGPRGVKLEATTTALFKIRFLRAIDEAMRIALHDGYDAEGKKRFRTFDIVAIVDRDGKENWLEIQAAEVT